MTAPPITSAGRFLPLVPLGIRRPSLQFQSRWRQFQKYDVGDARALFGLNPFIIQVRSAIALGVLDKRFVDSANNYVFRCFGRHFSSCFALSIIQEPGRRDCPSRANYFKTEKLPTIHQGTESLT